MNKKFLIVVSLVVLLIVPFISFAQINPRAILANIIAQLNTIVGGIVVIVFLFAGLMYLTAKGDPAKIATANKMLIWGAVGTAVAILSTSFEGFIRGLLR